MPAAKRTDPYQTFNFTVEIDGVLLGDFTEVSGLGMEVLTSDYRSGSDQTSGARKLSGLTKFTNVTLKRGVTGDPSLFNWIEGASGGSQVKRDVAITLLDEGRQPAMKWTLVAAVPIKWIGPNLNAKTGEAAIESIELACEGLKVEAQ